jgi:transcription antitermination factor NusG
MPSLNARIAPFDKPIPASADHLEVYWYAAYTRSRHEKRISEQLKQRSVEHFLPLYEAVHRWKDRRVRLQLPLFPCYVFVRLALRDQLKVLQIPGVVRLVGFNGRPTILPETEMLALRRGLSSGARAEPHPYLKSGQSVLITKGPFTGFGGILVRRKGLRRVVISLALIKSSVAVEVKSEDVLSS